jgi:hypothetical protein
MYWYPRSLWPLPGELGRKRSVPPRCPEPHHQPTIATCSNLQQPANMKLGRPLNQRATHENTLVMHSNQLRSSGHLRTRK